ncbi:MAG TPA: ABC transporter permease [Trueperaceae bacterium]
MTSDSSWAGSRNGLQGFRWQLRRGIRFVRGGGPGLMILLFLALVALLPSLFATHSPVQISPLERLQPPSTEHLFGTDHLGRDTYSRVVYGARVSIWASLRVVVSAGLFGTLFGAVSGLYGGSVDRVMMRVVDVFLAFPYLILAMGIAALLGRSLENAIIGLAMVWWAQYGRLVRNKVVSLRGQAYVTSARALGATQLRLMFRHILPNTMTPVFVKASLDMGQAILATASLSFIGLGAAPPSPEWGAMITESRSYILDAWWLPTFPGLGIFLAVLGFNMVGDSMRDLIDPRSGS